MIGTIIDGDYRVDRVLGEGSFGIVYACTEIPLNRTVALKMLSHVDSDAKELSRFDNEGKSLASLNHPNVVQVYRLGSFNSVPYIVMEFIEGSKFRDLLGDKPLPLGDILNIFRQVASGLAAIHGRGIIHRDLSSNNIQVSADGLAKILDLGLAKNVTTFSTTSGDGYLAGTIAYVAPEQIQGRDVSPAIDIFAMGVLLYESLALRHPFHAEHNMSLIYNIANREPPRLEEITRDVPDQLIQLVYRCLEKDPRERPTAVEVGTAIRTLMTIPDIGSLRASTAPHPEGAPGAPQNPYHNRAMIRKRPDFFGRKQEVRRIFARLNATPPGSVSVVGERKIGKSSLLNHVYMRHNRASFLERPELMVMVFLDFQEHKSKSIEAFVELLLTMVQYELRGRLDVPECSLDLDGVKQMVESLHGNGYRLAILMDEFESVTTNSNFELEFFSFLRFLANHYNVAYITSSARDLQVLCHNREISDSPFFNIFSTMRLSVFPREEALELIRVPSERFGKPLEAFADPLIEMAGLFPYFLQLACSHALEVMDESGSDAPDMKKVRDRFFEEARLHFRYVWGGFDDHERSAVRRVARRKNVPDSLQHVLHELEERHLVREIDDRPTLFSKVFEEFVLREPDEQSKTSWFNRILGRN